MEEKGGEKRELGELLGSREGKPLGNRELWNKAVLVLHPIILNCRLPLSRDP